MMRFVDFALKRLRYLILGGALLLIIAIGCLGFTSIGNTWTVNTAAQTFSNETLQIKTGKVTGLLTGELAVSEVTISDAAGEYARLSGIRLKWSPISLLTAKFKAELVRIDRITLTRRPKTEESPGASDADTETSNPLNLPLTVEIEEIDIPEVELAEPVLGRPFQLLIGGSLRAEDSLGPIDSELVVIRRDTLGANARLKIAYLPDKNQLTLEGGVDEPEGGLLANLLAIPEVPALSLQLTGTGALSDWTGQSQLALNSVPVFQMTANHTQVEEISTFTVSADGELDRFLPRGVANVFDGTTTIDLKARMDLSGLIAIERGEIGSNSLQLTAGGTYDPHGSNDLKLTLESVDGPLFIQPTVGTTEFSLWLNSSQLNISGPGDSAQVSWDAELTKIATTGVQIGDISLSTGSSAFNLSAGIGSLATRLEAGVIRFDNESVDNLIEGPFRLQSMADITKDTIQLSTMSVESPTLGGTAALSFTRTTGAASGQAKLFVLPDALPGPLSTAINGTAGLALNFSRSDEGAIKLTDLTIRSNAFQADGGLDLTEGELTARLSGQVPDIGLLLADGEGAANFELDVAGLLNQLSFDAGLFADQLKLAGRQATDFEFRAEGLADPENPTANLELSGTLDNQVVSAIARLTSENGIARIPELRVQAGTNLLTGALELTEAFLPSGDIDFSFPDVALLAALAGQDAGGDIRGQIKLRSSNNITSAKIDAMGAGLQTADLNIQTPRINVQITDASRLQIEGQISSPKLTSGTQSLDSIQLSFSQTEGVTQFSLASKLDGADLTAAGSLDPTGEQLAITLDTFAGKPRGIPLRLANQLRAQIASRTVRIEPVRVLAGDGQITISGQAGESLDLTLTLNSVPANLINNFAPTVAAAGFINGSVFATGKTNNPTIDYELTWRGAATAQTRAANIGALQITAAGRYANSTVSVQTAISNAAGLEFSGRGNIATSGTQALSLQVSGNAPFGLLASQLATQGMTLSGGANVNIEVSGTTAGPLITGTVSTSGARLVDARRNIAINDLAGTVQLAGETASLVGFTGTLSTGGTVALEGKIGYAGGSNYPADITLRLIEARYVDGQMIATNFSGALQLTGELLGQSSLAGRIDISEATITVPEQLPASLSSLNVQHKNASAEVEAQAKSLAPTSAGSGSNSNMLLDLTISAPRSIFVRGRGMDAELGGTLTMRGTAANPSAVGGFNLARGRLDLLGKRLTFSNGSISFAGSLVPRLNFRATTPAGSTTVIVTVIGSATNPTIAFSSSPSLPEDEVLAQLLFNQSTGQLSALQIAQLADAARQLAGIGASTSLLENIRQSVGSDDLDVATDDSGATEVTVGKYLNDNTYLELKQGGEDNTGRAVINLDIGGGVKLRGEADSAGEGAAGLFFEREY